MDELKQINSKNGIISIANALNKIVKPIQQNKSKSENEIDQLRSLCKSENQQVSTLATNAFVKLVENGHLEPSYVLPIFISFLSNTSFTQFAGFGNGIIEILLIDLKRRCSNNSAKYICQFDLKPPQHPLILLLSNSKEVSNMIFFNSKIVDICNHHDKIIKANSIEFLRPVFLYLLCNPTLHPESQMLWKYLLVRIENQHLILDILAWSKFSSPQLCLFTNTLILAALESEQESLMIELCVYLASITKNSMVIIDPTINFRSILTVLHKCSNLDKYSSILLMILADLMQNIPPIYLRELTKLIKFILRKSKSHYLGLHMLLDASIQWLAHSTYITDFLDDMDYIVNFVNAEDSIHQYEPLKSWILYANPEIAKYQELCNMTDVGLFLEKISNNSSMSDNINQILRAIFLYPHLNTEQFRKVFDILMALTKRKDEVAFKLLMLILYKLANDNRPSVKLILMQNLAALGAKDHVLGTLKALSKDIDRPFCYDLYLRLWKAEPRTYPFLYNILKDNSNTNKGGIIEWENDIAKVYTIREICKIKPEQHGANLLNLFSDILNRPLDDNSEIPISLAIDVISILCENRVVNVVSTWKVLGFKFNFEKRPQVVKSLCGFFGQIASIKSSTLEFEKLFIEIINRLWLYVTDFDEKSIIGPALKALQAFRPDTMNIKQIPEIFRQGIEISEEENADLQIPGDCWLQLIQFVNYQAIDEAGDLVAHHIYQEMLEYRGGVYLLPEGRPEPSSLKYLQKKSILAELVTYLIRHGKNNGKIVENELILTQMLRILAKDYPKPIPPLDWSFLHEYFTYSFEMKRHCFKIAAKQMKTSGTAKRLAENFINEIVRDNETLTEDDMFFIYENLKDLSESTRIDLFKKFIHKSLQFAYDCSTQDCFENDSLFEKILKLLLLAVRNKSEFMIEQNVDAICDFIENYFDRIPINSTTFTEYKKLVSAFPTSNLNNFIKPLTWTEINSVKLMKAIEIQCEMFENCPIIGLNDILMAVAQQNDEKVKQHFLNEISRLLGKKIDEKYTSGWISLLIGQIQTILATNSIELIQVLYMIDVFLTTIIKLSGIDVLTEKNLGDLTTLERLEKFSCALHLLFQQNILRDVENKIYEFLYYLYNNKEIPTTLADYFRKTLISCKNQSYFTKTWQKFVSMRRI